MTISDLWNILWNIQWNDLWNILWNNLWNNLYHNVIDGLSFITDLFSILIISVIVIDISGFVYSIKVAIGKYLGISPNSFRIKPFDCSFCMTFWVSMIYLLVVGRFTLVNIAIVLLLCCLTTPLKNLVMSVRDKLTKWMDF